ncbi:hypothetical protein VTN02DRAFT_5445 [Thermoascus thermophilus]
MEAGARRITDWAVIPSDPLLPLYPCIRCSALLAVRTAVSRTTARSVRPEKACPLPCLSDEDTSTLLRLPVWR